MTGLSSLEMVALLGLGAIVFVHAVVKETRRREKWLRRRLEERRLESELSEHQRKLLAEAPQGVPGVLEAAHLNRSLQKPAYPPWSAKGMFRE
jgi:hypothetical protein